MEGASITSVGTLSCYIL